MSSLVVIGLRGSLFRIFEELEFTEVGLLSSRRRKNEERSKQVIKNFTMLHR
jgi:hypothetical protein